MHPLKQLRSAVLRAVTPGYLSDGFWLRFAYSNDTEVFEAGRAARGGCALHARRSGPCCPRDAMPLVSLKSELMGKSMLAQLNGTGDPEGGG